MAKKPYQWTEGAALDEHSRRKHKILREYFSRYLTVRCQLPQQSKFRLAVVDGFSGAGRYRCGSPGSPIIIVEELRTAVERFNIRRAREGLSPIDIECLLILNDVDRDAIKLLEQNLEPLLGATKSESPRLHIQVLYCNSTFESLFPQAKGLLEQGRYRNVLFLMDQCGHTQVHVDTIRQVIASFPSSEVFYTFAIQSLLAFLAKSNPELLTTQLRALGVQPQNLDSLNAMMSNQEWLGAAERLVFQVFREAAPYVSPFSIHNPEGWRYWLIHFASSYRARQEYNNVLHQNSSMQAHFGRSGLDMLTFDPNHNGSLNLFDMSGREKARDELNEDVPR